MANKIELRKINRNTVFKCVFNNEGISRQDIAAQTSLSIPTVLQNLKELESMGLVNADGVFESTGGRKAKVIKCNYNAKHAIGIDITENHITIAGMDMAGRIVMGGERDIFHFEDTGKCYDAINKKLSDLISGAGMDPDSILGVGISVPCIVDRSRNRITYSKVIRAPENMFDKFSERIPYRVEIFNDANAAGFAEIWQADSEKNIFYLMLSNSVGGAVIGTEGIYLGDNCRGAEVGHMRIEPRGKKCYCGQKGCVNAYCSAHVLADTRQGKLERFFEDMEAGDEKLKEKFHEYLEYLAVTVVNLRMLYDCEIILGGYVGACMEKYMDQLRDMVGRLDPYDHTGGYVQQCHYRVDASAVGAGMTFIDEYIKSI